MLANVVLAAALVSTASAHLPAVAKREFLQSRQDQDQDIDAACVSAVNAVMPLYDSLPNPPDDLLSVTLPAEPCATPTFTGSLASEFSSYTSEVMDWYSSNSAAINSAIASCTSLADYEFEVPVCSSSGAAGASATTTEAASTTATPGSSSSGPTSTSGTSSSSSSSSTVTPTANAAPRETGYVMVAAAAAAAGLMGVVAAL
ncbi:hypothetical protein F5X96DRAFT_630955 [Biscogniauxia mediterranea]|nr:hypothetical protein F5X96DRAFT_630955 [Biscogniauxia mediterranea]